jgi:hypothetical protein
MRGPKPADNRDPPRKLSIANRIAGIDRASSCKLDTPERLLACAGDRAVAALTGASILQGTAATTPIGSTIHLDGGGGLDSATPASGALQVGDPPWQLQLADPANRTLTDTILGVH